jgi:hypothetical protein
VQYLPELNNAHYAPVRCIFCIIALRRYCAAKRGKKLFQAHAEITLCIARDQSLTQMRQFGAEDEKNKKGSLGCLF